MENKPMKKSLVRTESIHDGIRYGLGRTAIFKISNYLDKHVYVYAKYINGSVHIATSDYKFKKFDEDHPVRTYGTNSNLEVSVNKEVIIKINKAYTEDGIYFTIEYDIIIE